MRRPPPPHPRGAPKTPGSGRRRGSLNRKTIELRALMSALTADVDYQQKLRQAFVRRRLHPSTEMRIWEYTVGKPKEEIEMSTKLSMDARLAEERRVFAALDLRDLEQLAAESQALVDRALAMLQAQRVPPASAGLAEAASVKDNDTPAEARAAARPALRCAEAADTAHGEPAANGGSIDVGDGSE
jgi:hypothetical protein